MTSEQGSSDPNDGDGKQRRYGPFMAVGLGLFAVLYVLVRLLLY